MNQYVIRPPSIPMFLYKRYAKTTLQDLIRWAVKEHHARLIYCAERGYWKELRNLNENYSPIRVLAEIKGFRKICASINQQGWNELTGRERVFIRRSYEMRELLYKARS